MPVAVAQLDQASELRRLVLRAGSLTDRRRGAPRIVLVSGGSSGVGTTTIAINLATAWAQDQRRTLLIDASPLRRDCAQRTVTPLCTLDDVLCEQAELASVLSPGPAGMFLALGGSGNVPETANYDYLLQQVYSLGAAFDIVLVDLGAGPHAATEVFWPAADQLLLVATPHDETVCAAYALLKQHAVRRRLPADMQLIVNQASPGEAASVAARFAQSCRRFLNVDLETHASLLDDAACGEAARRGSPVLLWRPESPFATCVWRLARRVAERAFTTNS